MISGELLASYGGRSYSSPAIAVDRLRADLTDLQTRVIPNALRRSMERYLKLIAGRMVSRHGNPWPSGTTARSLSRRSGKAIDSIYKSVRVEQNGFDEIVGYIGGNFYVGVHEFGATITAKRSGYLTIPLPAALSLNGVPLKRRARDWKDTFVKKSKRGNLLIFQKRGDEIVPLYVLKKSVKIPRRLGMKKELISYQNLLFSFVEQDMRKEFKL